MMVEAPPTLSAVCRENLLALARAYGKANRMTLGAVSKEFYGNVKFLPKFAAGKGSVSLAKVDEMMEKFRERWPKGVAWPYLGAIIFERPKKIRG